MGEQPFVAGCQKGIFFASSGCFRRLCVGSFRQGYEYAEAAALACLAWRRLKGVRPVLCYKVQACILSHPL